MGSSYKDEWIRIELRKKAGIDLTFKNVCIRKIVELLIHRFNIPARYKKWCKLFRGSYKDLGTNLRPIGLPKDFYLSDQAISKLRHPINGHYSDHDNLENLRLILVEVNLWAQNVASEFFGHSEIPKTFWKMFE